MPPPPLSQIRSGSNPTVGSNRQTTTFTTSAPRRHPPSLPPPITGDSRVSFARLTTPPDAIVRWKVYLAREEDEHPQSSLAEAEDALHRHTTLEMNSMVLSGGYETKENDNPGLLQGTLWTKRYSPSKQDTSQGERQASSSKIKLDAPTRDTMPSNAEQPIQNDKLVSRRQSAIWIFEIARKEAEVFEAEIDNQRGDQKLLLDSKDHMKNCLAKLHCEYESCDVDLNIHSFFKDPFRQNDGFQSGLLSLLDGGELQSAYRSFMKAIESRAVTRWVWARSQDRKRWKEDRLEKKGKEEGEETEGEDETIKESSIPTQSIITKFPITEEGEFVEDEEEEGALDDLNEPAKEENHELQQNVRDNKFYRRPGKKREPRLVVRYGDGVVILPAKEAKENCDVFFQGARTRTATRFRAEAHLDDNGQIFLSTSPSCDGETTMRTSLEAISTTFPNWFWRKESPDRQIKLAPLGLSAVLVEWIGPLADKTEWNGEAFRNLTRAKDTLMQWLQARGVDVDDIGNDWVLCQAPLNAADPDETVKEVDFNLQNRFLFPADLCLALNEPRQSSMSLLCGKRLPGRVPFSGFSLVNMPLQNIVQQTATLLRDSSRSSKDLTRPTYIANMKLGNVEEAPKTPIATSMDSETSFSEPLGASESGPIDRKMQNSMIVEAPEEKEEQEHPGKTGGAHVDERHHYDGNEEVETAATSFGTEKAATPMEKKQNGEDDEEMDLWGDFTFEEEPNRGDKDGYDDGMFGLVTEDDFSFFDNAGATALSSAVKESSDAEMSAHEFRHPQTITGNAAEGRSREEGHTSIGNGASSGNGSFAIDHPSLPAFTPGSLTASSPTVVGAQNAKTPRTPYSPMQDMADISVMIEGEQNLPHAYQAGELQHRPLHHRHPSDSLSFDGTPRLDHGGTDKSKVSKTSPLNGLSRKRPHADIFAKYEMGKYALPRSMQQIQSRTQDATGGSPTHLRRLRLRYDQHAGIAQQSSRTQHRQHPKLNITAIQKRRLGLPGSGADVERTDNEGNFGGTTPSDRSSLYDDLSDTGERRGEREQEEDQDDEDGGSGDDDDEESDSDSSRDFAKDREREAEETAVLLQAAQDVLASFTVEEEVIPSHDDMAKNLRLPDESSMATLVSWLVDNPQMRGVACAGRHLKSVQRTKAMVDAQDSLELFTPFESEQSSKVGYVLGGRGDDSHSRERENHLVEMLDPPRMLVGCQEAVTAFEPSVLPFWEKLALHAVSGIKHVTALALHTSDRWHSEIFAWLNRLGHAYKTCGLGTHQIAKDGVLSIGTGDGDANGQTLESLHSDGERWAETIDSIYSQVKEVLSEKRWVVVYVIGEAQLAIPFWILVELQSSLRARLQAQGLFEDSVNVFYSSWPAFNAFGASLPSVTRQDTGTFSRPALDVRKIAFSVYDSLRVPVTPRINQEAHLPQLPDFATLASSVQFPSFTLLPRSITSIDRPSIPLQLQWSAGEHVNLSQHGLALHVGYSIAQHTDVVNTCSVIDERGQGHHAEAWAPEKDIAQNIKRIWTAVRKFATRAKVAWKITVCKRSCMPVAEVDEWLKVLNKDGAFEGMEQVLDVSIACASDSTSLAIVPLDTPIRGGGGTARRTQSEIPTSAEGLAKHTVDTSRVFYALYPASRMEMGQSGLVPLRSSSTVTLFDDTNMSTAITASSIRKDKRAGMEEDVMELHPSRCPHILNLHLLCVHPHQAAASDPQVDLDRHIRSLTRSFHELEFIGRDRFLLVDEGQHLPWHLGILDAIARGAKSFPSS